MAKTTTPVAEDATGAEARATFQNLQVDFRIAPSPPINSREISLFPGGDINFVFEIKNMGAKPVSGLRVAVGAARYLQLDPWGLRGLSEPQAAYARQKFTELTTTGVPILQSCNVEYVSLAHTDRNRLNPYASKYYNQELGVWNSIACAYAHRTEHWGEHSAEPWGLRLQLSSKLRPAHDVGLFGYVVIQGHRFPVGRFTVHIMYPPGSG